MNEQHSLFEEVICAFCNKKISRLDSFIVEKHTNGDDLEIPFCNEQEANDFYLERLRSSGM